MNVETYTPASDPTRRITSLSHATVQCDNCGTVLRIERHVAPLVIGDDAHPMGPCPVCTETCWTRFVPEAFA